MIDGGRGGVISAIPLRRFARPEEIARAALFILQDDYYTGRILEVDGGYGEWLTNSMNRIFADMNDAREEALRLAEIGRKSVAALFRPTADAVASTKNTVSSTAAGMEAR